MIKTRLSANSLILKTILMFFLISMIILFLYPIEENQKYNKKDLSKLIEKLSEQRNELIKIRDETKKILNYKKKEYEIVKNRIKRQNLIESIIEDSVK